MRMVASERERGRLNAEMSRKSAQGRRVAASERVVFLTRERKPPSVVVVADILRA